MITGSYMSYNRFSMLCMLMMFLIAITVVQDAMASDAITKVLCNAINQLTGTVGKSIASLIVISLAIALFLGKVTWGIAVAVGMGILFGATGVVQIMSGNTTSIC